MMEDLELKEPKNESDLLKIYDSLKQLKERLELIRLGRAGNTWWARRGDMTFRQEVLLDFIEEEKKKSYREGRKEALERVALETRVNVCECGEEWKDSDLGVWLEEELSKLNK